MSPPRQNSLGKVYLVGAGPGDPDLITVRGKRALALADLVLYDYLVNPELLQHAGGESELVSLGHSRGRRGMTQEEVIGRMIAAAREGKTVVRLKSGDPNLFGRGAEEMRELSAAGIPFEVVPGVTAAVAAACHAGISLTNRECASAVALVTGHQRSDGQPPDLDYDALARFPGTLVFYMGISTAAQWSSALVRGKTAANAGGYRTASDLARSRDLSLPAGSYCRTDRAIPSAAASGDHRRRSGCLGVNSSQFPFLLCPAAWGLLSSGKRLLTTTGLFRMDFMPFSSPALRSAHVHVPPHWRCSNPFHVVSQNRRWWGSDRNRHYFADRCSPGQGCCLLLVGHVGPLVGGEQLERGRTHLDR